MKRLFTLILIVTTVSCVCFAQSTDEEKYELADRYYDAKEYNKAIPILNELIIRNHAKAMNMLGNCYYDGNGVNKDFKKSFELYQKSANLGWADGQFNVGLSYYYGKGVNQNYKQAVAWWTKAADQGLADAQHNLAVCYKTGRGVDVDLDKAVYYYELAASNGITKAMVSLGWLYFKNEDYANQHIEDESKYGPGYFYKQAEKWFRLAVKENNVEGLYGLAEFYYEVNFSGDSGIWEQVKKATPLFEKAANMNHWRAQIFMGYAAMRDGDLNSAMNWFSKAEENGEEDYSFGLTIRQWKTVCSFFMKNSQYRFFWNSDCCSINHCLYPEDDYLYVGATLNGKFGFLKISYSGKILDKTPFVYDDGDMVFPYYDKESKLFHVNYNGNDITIDITGKEI